MIFASDIDRTLVFSTNSSDLPECYEVIEERKGDVISFMESGDLKSLKELSEYVEFVPVTSRNIEQLNRLRFDEFGIRYRYAVVDSGFKVYFDGELDYEWDNYMRSKLVYGRLSELVSLLCKHEFTIKTHFDFGIRLDLLDADERNRFDDLLIEFGDEFRVVSDHRYVTVMYSFVDKSYALEYVRKKLDDEFVVFAGDSEFDEMLLTNADVGLYCGFEGLEGDFYRSYRDGYLNVSWVLGHVRRLINSYE